MVELTKNNNLNIKFVFYFYNQTKILIQALKNFIQSYSYNTAEVRIVWRDWEPVSIPDPNTKKLPDFELISYSNKKSTLTYTAGII